MYLISFVIGFLKGQLLYQLKIVERTLTYSQILFREICFSGDSLPNAETLGKASLTQ